MFDKIIDAPAPNFKRRRLAVRLAGLMGSRLLLDGAPVPRSKSVYKVADDNGKETTIRLKTSFFDCIPKLEIDGQPLTIARELAWYEQLLAWLPMALAFPGRIPGAFIGWVFANINMRLLHSSLPRGLQFTIVLLNNAIGFFIVIAVQLGLARILQHYMAPVA